MRLFAPRNEWNYKSSDSWFNLTGQQSSAGISVTYRGAETLSAVSCGIRVYSEAIAQLPCVLLEQEDYRTTSAATGHPLWPIIHDEPNPEQTKFQFFSYMSSLAVGWGNAYAEIQRDSTNRIVALWPIHPSRIPKRNIRRNSREPSNWDKIRVGDPGEIVYYVNNDDGSAYPIASRDMLHVPGMLSDDGITGRGIVEIGLQAIGIALATEEHAGAFFRNGASPNIAIKSQKVVGKETADRLRQQWQSAFGGVRNHYKTVLLEDGMEPVPFSISPEASQLLTSRQFSVDELSRILKLPPHKLNSLSRATWGNIEQQAQEFVDYSLMPWVKQWEETLFKKLLSPAEKKRYRFKINVMALLRGDSAARSAFYRSLFDMGALSPNDIRELEDWNPINDGDQYFVPANNLVPLSMIEDYVENQMQPPQPSVSPQPPESSDDEDIEDDEGDADEGNEPSASKVTEMIASAALSQAKAESVVQSTQDAIRLSVQAVIEGMMHRESRAMRQAAKKPETFLAWRDDFYPEFRDKLASAIAVFEPAAERLGASISSISIADGYVAASIAGIEPLADLSCKDFEPAVLNLIDSWAERPANCAARAIKERVSHA